MKKLIVSLFFLTSTLFSLPVQAGIPVSCVNCSDRFIQELRHVKDIEQLAEAIKQYQNMIARYENMLQNTANLPMHLKDNIILQMKYAVQDLKNLKAYNADLQALQTIFKNAFPGYEAIEDLVVNGEPVSLDEAIKLHNERNQTWSDATDRLLQQGFSMSGSQLDNLINSGRFDSHMQDLLSTREGRMQAIEAGNQIQAMNVQELRSLRALLATHIQAQNTYMAKQQAQEQEQEAQSKEFYGKGKFKSTVKIPYY